jgi:rubrerythrin
MNDREREKTLKALEELVKVEQMAIAAYEQALEVNEDGKLSRKYNRFLRDHERQARNLNNRLVELGGQPVEAGVGAGTVKAGLWARITGMAGDRASLSGMYAGAKDGISRYLKHLDDIHDAKALGIIRRNLESKQDEIEWLEEQMAHAEEVSGKQAKEAREQKIEQAVKAQEKEVSKGGLFGLPVWLLLAGIAAAVFIFLRRQSEPDFGDEAFQYETSEFGAEDTSGSTAGYASGANGGTDTQMSTPTV